MKVSEFVIRRLATMTEQKDLNGVGALLELLFMQKYQESTTDDMMDELRRLDTKVQVYIANGPSNMS